MSWEDLIADTCHAMFGFEKPRWHRAPAPKAPAAISRSYPRRGTRFCASSAGGQDDQAGVVAAHVV
jgi:hypothetical protein